jgi:hypothetical protein
VLVGDRLGRQVGAGTDQEAIADVTFPVAEQRQVHGQGDRLVAGGHGALDQAPTQVAVGRGVELEPARGPRRGGGDLLDHCRGDGRERHQRAGGGGATGRCPLRLGVGELVQGGRRGDHREWQRAAERHRRQVAGRDIDEHPWPEAQAIPRGSCIGQGDLVAGPAGVVVPRPGLDHRAGERLVVRHGDRSLGIGHARG